MSLRHAALGALIALSSTACGPRPTDHPTLADARAAGAVSQGLLPDDLPPSTALIRIERDEDRASGYFHFSSSDYAGMAARFAPLAQLPPDPALQTWVKRKDLAGYEAYTLAQGGAPGCCCARRTRGGATTACWADPAQPGGTCARSGLTSVSESPDGRC